jgi:hypothetical protein
MSGINSRAASRIKDVPRHQEVIAEAGSSLVDKATSPLGICGAAVVVER